MPRLPTVTGSELRFVESNTRDTELTVEELIALLD